MAYSPNNPCHTSRGAVIGTSTRNAGVKDTSTSPGPNAYYVKGDFDKPRKEKILSYSNFSGDRDLGESPGPGQYNTIGSPTPKDGPKVVIGTS